MNRAGISSAIRGGGSVAPAAPQQNFFDYVYKPVKGGSVYLDDLQSLYDTPSEGLLYGAIDPKLQVWKSPAASVKQQYTDAYNKYVKNKDLWEKKPKGLKQNALGQYSARNSADVNWLAQWDQANPGTTGPEGEYIRAPITEPKNDEWDSEDFDISNVKSSQVYKYLKSIAPSSTSEPDAQNFGNLSPSYSGATSDHESGDAAYGQYQAKLVRNALESMFPGQDDALDEAAAKVFRQNANSGSDYATHSVYSSPQALVWNITKVMQSNGFTPAVSAKDALKAIDPKWQSKMDQAVKGHRAEDNADDGDGFFSAIVPIALSFFGAPYLAGAFGAGATASTMTNVLANAAAGSITGGVSAALTGGDVGKGVLTGGISGGIGSATSGWNPTGNQLVDSAIKGGIKGMATGAVSGNAGTGLLSGATGGVVGSVIPGNDFLSSAGRSLATGAITKGLIGGSTDDAVNAAVNANQTGGGSSGKGTFGVGSMGGMDQTTTARQKIADAIRAY